MSKPKSITEQIEEMQEANKRLLEYENLFSKACQLTFGFSAKTIKEKLKKSEESCSDFGTKICKYFHLKNEQDMADFINVMCSETSLNYFRKNRVEDAQKQG